MGCCQSAQALAPGFEQSTNDAGPNILTGRIDMAKSLSVSGKEERLVMGRYMMGLGKAALMGEGASSICWKGTDIKTGESVAIKVYKDKFNVKNSKTQQVMLKRFARQIDVLQKLMEPLKRPSDTTLWHPALETVTAASLFMILIDFSKNRAGIPGTDAASGVVYVVTELAQYSLKDFIEKRVAEKKPLAMDTVKAVTRAILLVVAGLHSKGLVHLDLKPENLMVFKGRVKLIDVDGCVKMNTQVSIKDSSISFSPCYCSPEWSRFIIDESQTKITILPALDVWSVGLTICELVMNKPVMKAHYLNFLGNSRSHQETSCLFLEWLSHVRKAPLPSVIEQYSPAFRSLLTDCLLVTDSKRRKSCAQCLDDPFVFTDSLENGGDAEIVLAGGDSEVRHTSRARPVDASTAAPLYKGTLWKLKVVNGNPNDPTHWLQRDMWLGQQGSLCYFSQKENKRLVLIDASKLADATISRVNGWHRPDAFQVKYFGDNEDQTMILAADGPEQYDEWTSILKGAVRLDIPTMRLGDDMSELRQFVVRVQNRRRRVDEGAKEEFEPVYKEKLWKLKADGDPRNEEHWFEREMWIAQNGCLVYYSKKEERDLVYYTAADLMRASYSKAESCGEWCKEWSFQVNLDKTDDVEFAPGHFAARTKEVRDCWLEELEAVSLSSFSEGGFMKSVSQKSGSSKKS